MILSTKDFTGQYSNAENKFTDIDFYIHKYENEYAKRILGGKLYEQFIAQMVSESGTEVEIPSNFDFKQIFYQFENNIGLKNCLRNFVYFEYQKNIYAQKTVGGTRENASELNEATDYKEILKSIHYEAVKNAREIQNQIFNEANSFESVKRATGTILNTEFSNFKDENIITNYEFGADSGVLIAERKFTSMYQLLIAVSQKLSALNENYKFGYQLENLQGSLICDTKEASPVAIKVTFIKGSDNYEYNFTAFTNTENTFKDYAGQQIEHIIF